MTNDSLVMLSGGIIGAALGGPVKIIFTYINSYYDVYIHMHVRSLNTLISLIV